MAEYDPVSIEKKWQKYWADNRTFAAGKPGAKKYYVLDMFPYPSGAGLHVGHPLGYTASDIYSRFMRMRGYSVLHPMGFDAFGLPAEQHAIATGEHPAEVTRKNCQVFAGQLKRVGLSYDWDRMFATTDPDYYRWTQWIFLKIYDSWFDSAQQKARHINELPIPEDVKAAGAKAVEDYKAGFRLAYRSEAMVNWCPALGTVLANEEVIDGKSERGGHDVIRKPMKQWFMRITAYAERLISELEEIQWPENIKEQQKNWIGKKHGAEIVFPLAGTDKSLTCFTTRPDTLFGVTFFVVAPEHPLVSEMTRPECEKKVKEYCEAAARMSELTRTIENRQKTGVFTGSFVINPISGKSVPVYVGDYVLASYGTGAVMGVPAHDARDFDFARKFQIDIVPVIVPEKESEEVMQAVREGEIAWTETGRMLPFDAQVAKELKLEGMGSEEAGRLITRWVADHGHGRATVNYKLRDWLFSRQRYWGEPFPVIHWEDGTSSSVPESELPLTLPHLDNYKPSEGGESPLARATDWVNVVDPKTGRKGRRETDTMPNWAGSCWYYLRFIDPKNDAAGWAPELEKGWMPVDQYVGGAEHAVLHLLYARFWHKILFDLGFVSTREPFQRLFNQGMVQSYAFKDSRGALVPVDQVDEAADGSAVLRATGEKLERIVAKMSKSLRNVITLDSIVDEYGADSLRIYLMFMGPLNTSRLWDPKAISGCYRFLKRACTFVTGGIDSELRQTCSEAEESKLMKREINALIKKAGEDIEAFAFNTVVSSMMEFLNSVSNETPSKASLEKFVLLLSPFAPHLAEELWEKLGHKSSIAAAPWPAFDASLIEKDVISVVIQIAGKKRGLLELPAGISEDELKVQVIAQMAGTNYKVSEKDRFITVRHPDGKPRLVNVIQ